MTGITSLNGLDLSYDELFYKIRSAGFGSVLLWWDDSEKGTRGERAASARKNGLVIENAHASTADLNSIWLDGDGDRVIEELMRELYDCAKYEIGTMVVHLTKGDNPPGINTLGMSRIERLIKLSDDLGVKLAFENMRVLTHIKYILENYPSPLIGMCYDSGHEHFWTPGIDWLSLYGDRVFAIHLHDNFGDCDEHMIPYDGTADWDRIAKGVASSAYSGTITVECEHEKSPLYRNITFDDFLKKAVGVAEKLEKKIRPLA